MGATFARLKVWIANEDLLFSDLNAEFDNILNNLSPQGMDDYSVNVAQMRAEMSPGAVGTESLATSISGELERLRFALRRIVGSTYWYEAPVLSLTEANSLLTTGNAVPPNRIVSGRMRTTSDQPIFLVPDGTAATVKLDGAPTAFVFRVSGTQYTISSDVLFSGLSTAPGTNNTALVNDANLTGQLNSKYAGEEDGPFPTLTIDTVGTEISSLVGKFAAFKVGTEFFIAFVKSATELTKAMRGAFFDSVDAPNVRVTISNNDVITLARLTWIFARTDGTLDVSYTNPSYAFDQPGAPGSGDYWFDLSVNTWKKFTGASFVDATATLVGICAQDTTGCKAARSGDFFGLFESQNALNIEYVSATQVRSVSRNSKISVYGNTVDFGNDLQEWEFPTDLESPLTEQASTRYYVYVTQDGDTQISQERPYNRIGDIGGRYHPYNTWRCVGEFFNDSSSDVSASSVTSYGAVPANTQPLTVRVTTSATVSGAAIADDLLAIDPVSGAVTVPLPSAAGLSGKILRFLNTNSATVASGDYFRAITLDPYGAETVGGAATTSLDTFGESLAIISDGANWQILSRYIPSVEITYSPTLIGFGSPTISHATFQRIGNTVRISSRFTSGISTAVTAQFPLPSNMPAIANLTLASVVGVALNNATAAERLTLGTAGETALKFSLAESTPLVAALGSTIASNGDPVSIYAVVAIAGWSG